APWGGVSPQWGPRGAPASCCCHCSFCPWRSRSSSGASGRASPARAASISAFWRSTTSSSCSSPGRPSSTSSRSSRDRPGLRLPGKAALLARVRPEGDHGAEQEEKAGEPDQVDERFDQHLEVNRAVLFELVSDHEQVLRAEPVVLDRHLVRGLLIGEI